MKINELRNIIPMKYNSFYSVHGRKTPSKSGFKNLPMIKTFSRNINNELNNILLTLTKENKSINNFTHTNSTKFTEKSMNNMGKMSQNNFYRLTNYIKNKYAKNMTKIKNVHSTPNRVQEIKLNVNKTEYNNFNKKYYLIDKIQLEKPKTEIKLKNKNILLNVDAIYKKQKEEYKNIINSEDKKNKFLKNYSSFIYYQIFPKRMRNENSLDNGRIPNFFNFYLIKNLKKSHNIIPKSNQSHLIKNNSFFDYIIENVTHKVEYKNQNNERITIGLVKNLLDEELNTISNKLNLNLNSKMNQNTSIIDKVNKINKSTSTNEFNELKNLNQTYDKISCETNNSEKDFEDKIKKKIENKLIKLNNKYGFVNGSDNVYLNDKNSLNESFNMDNIYKNETEKDMKIKSRKKMEDDEDDYIGDYIWAIANDINNIDEFRKRINEKDNIFENTKIKNIFGKYTFIKNNNNNKNEKLRDFGNTEFITKKNIDFKDFQNDILELYAQYKLKKDLEERNKSFENKSVQKSKRRKTESVVDNTNTNLINLKKEKEIKPQINFKISSNNMQNILSLMSDEQQFEQFIHGFGGYYTDNEEKKILKQIKESNPNKKNIFSMYNEIMTNMEKERQQSKNVKRKLYKTENKSIFNPSQPNNNNNFNYNNSKKNSIQLNNGVNNNINIVNNNITNDTNIEQDSTKVNEGKNQKLKIKQNNIKIKDAKIKKGIKDKNNSENDNIENTNNIKEKTFKNEKNKKYEDVLTEEEKEAIINNKTTYKKDNKDKKVKFKNLKSDISNNGNNNINSDNKNKFNIKSIKENKNLDDFEKDFLVKINYLTDLDEKDKEQVAKYLEELEKECDNEAEESTNLYNKIKINNIHHLLKNFIKEHTDKDNDKNVRGFKKDFKRKKTDYFINMKNRFFLDRQINITEGKEEIIDEREEEEEEEEQISLRQQNKKRKRTRIFDFDDDFDSIHKKGLKRSISFKIKKKKRLTKIDKNSMTKINGRLSIVRSNSAKKEIVEDDWRKYLLKTSINKRKQTMRKSKFTKRKKKTIKISKKSFFVDEYKNVKNVIDEQDEEIETIKNEIKRKKLKKELVEKQLYEFFDKIQALKKGGDNTKKEIEELIDEQLEKMDYSKAKENESRVNNFIQDFDLNRTKNIFSKKFYSKRMHYLSPIIFFTKQNEEKISNKL